MEDMGFQGIKPGPAIWTTFEAPTMTTDPRSTKIRRRGKKGESKGSHEKESKVPKVEDQLVTDYSVPTHKSLLVTLDEDAPRWFDVGSELAGRNATTATDPPAKGQFNTKEMILKYRQAADELYQREVLVFNKMRGKSSDDKWVESTMKKGTLKDRIAATSVVVSSDPVHRLYSMDTLLQMAGCSESGHQPTNSRMAQLAAEALEDLFLNTYLPKDRKLIPLSQRPLYLYERTLPDFNSKGQTVKKNSQPTLSPRILLLWRFEEMVKEKYQMFLGQYLSYTLSEAVEQQKIPTIRSAANLLRSVPEGEATLLQLIVNKLGDPSKKVAAAAGYELRKVLQQHPAMQMVIAREVQQLAHRPRLSPRALYNCIIFLNQLKLTREENRTTDQSASFSLPASLITTYFRLFEVAISNPKSKDGDMASAEEISMKGRLLSALLAGVNRAHPYLPSKDKDMEEHMDALYRVVHTAPPAATTQALMLLFQVAVGTTLNEQQRQQEAEAKRGDRFYRALYATLGRREMIGAGKHLTMYFNLLYKSMKYDTNGIRVNTFAKKLLSMVLPCASPIVAASIYLLNEIMKSHPTLRSSCQDIPSGTAAFAVMDPTKREPKCAIILHGEKVENQRDDIVEQAPLWELAVAVHHYHPSVQKFAQTIGDVNYTGDPLKDFSLSHFLDKFAYRNPKSAERVAGKVRRGDSVAERRSGTESIMQSFVAAPLNDPSFLEKKDVPSQDAFFHQFFVERAKRDEIKGIVRKRTRDDEEEEDDAERELEALDAEEREVDFDKLEDQWETDSEEEAFVDELARGIMEDSTDAFPPDELDDEDPDTEDWSDLYEDEERAKLDEQPETEDDDYDFEETVLDDGDDEDDDLDMLEGEAHDTEADEEEFFDDGEIGDDDDGGIIDDLEDADEGKDEQDDDDAFMDDDDDGEEDNDYDEIGDEGIDDDHPEQLDEILLNEEAEYFNAARSTGMGASADYDESDLQADLALADDSSQEEDDPLPMKKPKSKELDPATFAAAEDYEDIIIKSWRDLKSESPVQNQRQEMAGNSAVDTDIREPTLLTDVQVPTSRKGKLHGKPLSSSKSRAIVQPAQLRSSKKKRK